MVAKYRTGPKRLDKKHALIPPWLLQQRRGCQSRLREDVLLFRRCRLHLQLVQLHPRGLLLRQLVRKTEIRIAHSFEGARRPVRVARTLAHKVRGVLLVSDELAQAYDGVHRRLQEHLRELR